MVSPNHSWQSSGGSPARRLPLAQPSSGARGYLAAPAEFTRTACIEFTQRKSRRDSSADAWRWQPATDRRPAALWERKPVPAAVLPTTVPDYLVPFAWTWNSWRSARPFQWCRALFPICSTSPGRLIKSCPTAWASRLLGQGCVYQRLRHYSEGTRWAPFSGGRRWATRSFLLNDRQTIGGYPLASAHWNSSQRGSTRHMCTGSAN